MQTLRKVVASCTLSFLLLSGSAFAQDHQDDHGRPNQDNHGRQDQGNHGRQNQDGPGRSDRGGPQHAYVRHQEWRKGYHMRNEDWSRGERIDYRQNHLRRPPSGYEWRQVDGNYVMAAVATGVIASVVIAANSGR